MPRIVKDADLLVFENGTSGTSPADADEQIPNEDLLGARLDERAQNQTDVADIVVDNRNATYTSTTGIGDRVIWRTKLSGETSFTNRWTGMVTERVFERRGPVEHDLTLQCTDFVYGILQNRNVTDEFINTQVSGTSSSIVNTIINDQAPEIGTGQIDSITDTRTVQYDSTSLFEAIRRIWEQRDVVMRADGQDLVFKDRGGLSSQFTLSASDRKGAFTHRKSDRQLYNDICIENVVDNKLDSEQTAEDSTVTVTNTSRKVQKVTTKKAEIDVVEVKVDKDPNSSDGLRVGIQETDGSGNPVDKADRDFDEATQLKKAGELKDAFIRFDMPSHNLNNRTVFIIVEATGSTGQGVRVDSTQSGDPLTHKIFAPFTTSSAHSDGTSQSTYRERDMTYRRGTVEGLTEASDLGTTLLNKYKDPVGTVDFRADSTQAYDLSAGELITVDNSTIGVSSTDYLIMTKNDQYDGHLLQSDITAQRQSTV